MYNTLLPCIAALNWTLQMTFLFFSVTSFIWQEHILADPSLSPTTVIFIKPSNLKVKILKSWNLAHHCIVIMLIFLKHFFSKLSLLPKPGGEGVVSWEEYLLLIGSAWWPHWNGEDQDFCKINFWIIWKRQNSPKLNRYDHPTRRQQPSTSSTAFIHPPHPTAVVVVDRKPAKSFSTFLIHCR